MCGLKTNMLQIMAAKEATMATSCLLPSSQEMAWSNMGARYELTRLANINLDGTVVMGPFDTQKMMHKIVFTVHQFVGDLR